MPTICFGHPAFVFDMTLGDDEESYVTDPEVLKTLDGLEYVGEVFSDYLHDGRDIGTLKDAQISGGTLSFSFHEESEQLIAVTGYSVSRPLKKKEIAFLREFTSEQWTDGIGDNFYQERIDCGLAPQIVIEKVSNIVNWELD